MEKGERIVVLRSSNDKKIEVYAHGTYLGIDKNTGEEMLALYIIVNNKPMTVILKMNSFDYIAKEEWLSTIKRNFPHVVIEENFLGKQFEEDLNK